MIMAGAERHPGNPPRPPGTVHVILGVYENRLPLGGESVLAAKTFLRNRASISYFAKMVVNGQEVPVNHVLQDGDCLTCIRPPGFKGAPVPQEPFEKFMAEGLIRAYPGLVRIAKAVKRDARKGGWDTEQIVEVTAARVARFFEDHFGPVIRDAVATFNEVVKKLNKFAERADRLNHGKAPKKPGRKNTTQDIADFAEARHRKMSWKDIADEWNQKHPQRHFNHEKVRGAWERRYGSKAVR
jgi:hypothetical protein